MNNKVLRGNEFKLWWLLTWDLISSSFLSVSQVALMDVKRKGLL